MPRQAGQPFTQLRKIIVVLLIEIHRMQAQRGMQVRVALHQIPDALPVVPVHPEYHHFPDAQGAAFGQQRRPVHVEIGKVQVGVGVDQFHVEFRRFSLGECAV